jgi:hypothetical protein
MANGILQRYADMINLQVASEAFLHGAGLSQIKERVIAGNTANTKEPNSIADLFSDGSTGRYQLVAHQDLTRNDIKTIPGALDKSGFSASIFLDKTTS